MNQATPWQRAARMCGECRTNADCTDPKATKCVYVPRRGGAVCTKKPCRRMGDYNGLEAKWEDSSTSLIGGSFAPCKGKQCRQGV